MNYRVEGDPTFARRRIVPLLECRPGVGTFMDAEREKEDEVLGNLLENNFGLQRVSIPPGRFLALWDVGGMLAQRDLAVNFRQIKDLVLRQFEHGLSWSLDPLLLLPLGVAVKLRRAKETCGQTAGESPLNPFRQDADGRARPNEGRRRRRAPRPSLLSHA